MDNMNLDIFEVLKTGLSIEDVAIDTYSPLTLAFVGDNVYELILRTKVVTDGNTAVNKLNKMTSDLACAKFQCELVNALMDELNEEEIRVFKRGRNAKSNSKAKNASYNEYKHATGFETLIGYLYLTHNSERIFELLKIGFSKVNGENR